MSGIEKINSVFGGLGGATNITGGNTGIQQAKNTEQSGGQEKTKEQENMEKAQKLAGENDITTLEEALKQKDGNAGVAEEEGQGNEGAKTIADENDKEVIEKAIEIRHQEEAKQNQQAMMEQQQNKVNISPDAMAGNTGGQEGTIPQSSALKNMV